MKIIESNVIGILVQNNEFDDWWVSELIEIPFFNNQKLKFTFMDFDPESDFDFIKETDSALEVFINKNDIDRLSISSLVHQNCIDFLNEIGFEKEDKYLWEIEDSVNIWDHVQPMKIYISRRAYNDKDIYVDINCSCDWEQEHGLQLVFRQGKKITRVSQIDGHLTDADAYGKADREDELLSQF